MVTHNLLDFTERVDPSTTFVQPKRLDNEEELKNTEGMLRTKNFH
jgi:hypothetical protein